MKPQDAEQFLGFPEGSFDHIPIYALDAALEAIANVKNLEARQLFRPGLYYIGLIDLTASTVASAKLSGDLNQKRIQAFITATVEALGSIELKNYAQFIKEIGDASLFLFSSFDDLHDWWSRTQYLLNSYNQEYLHSDEIEESEWQYFELTAKTVVHLGEVSYMANKAPMCLAVNQVFKIEKLFGPGQLGATEAVRQSASPTIKNRKLNPTQNGEVVLPGDEVQTTLWLLDTSNGQ